MFLFAVSVLVVAQSSSEIPEGLMNNPVHNELSVKQQQHFKSPANAPTRKARDM